MNVKMEDKSIDRFLHLEGKLVFVSGSSQGIGKAIAIGFAQVGATVLVNGRNESTVNEVVKEISKEGKAFGVVGDLSSSEQTEKIIKEIEKYGPLDVLVNNVGIFATKPFETIPDEEWMHYFNVNVMSAVRLSRHFLPQMKMRNQGRIIIMASESGVKPNIEMIHYSVTKTALIGLARCLAELTKGTQVTVNSVLAGPTMTEGVEKYLEGLSKQKGQSLEVTTNDYFKWMEPTSLIQRFLEPKEIADVVLFLSSALASGVNGCAQRVEGGMIRTI